MVVDMDGTEEFFDPWTMLHKLIGGKCDLKCSFLMWRTLLWVNTSDVNLHEHGLVDDWMMVGCTIVHLHLWEDEEIIQR